MSSSEQPGDLEACVRAFEGHFLHVQRTLRRMGVAPADAQDLSQEVFIVMWRRWSDFDQSRPVRPWLTGIALKVVGGHLRRSRREVPVADIEALESFDASDSLDSRSQGEDGLAASRARAIVLRALECLPESYRVVLVLRDLQGVPMRQIAALQGVPLFTAYTRLRKARRDLAEAVKLGNPERDRRPAVLLFPVPLLRALWRGAFAAAAAAGLLWLFLSAPDVHGEAERVRAAARPSNPSPRTVALRSPSAARLPPPRLVAAPLTTAPEHAEPAHSRGLLGHWRFDESPTTTVRDHSPARGDCLLRSADPGAAWTDGRWGAALQLASRGWLECPQPRLADGGADALSVTAWVKVQSLPHDGIRGVVTRPLGRKSEDHFLLGFSRGRVFLNSHSWGVMLVHRQNLAGDGRWHHLAFSRSRDAITLYVDGRPVRQQKLLDPRPDPVEGPVYIGGGSNRPGQVVELLDGSIDEVMIFGRALEGEEIARLASQSSDF